MVLALTEPVSQVYDEPGRGEGDSSRPLINATRIVYPQSDGGEKARQSHACIICCAVKDEVVQGGRICHPDESGSY